MPVRLGPISAVAVALLIAAPAMAQQPASQPAASPTNAATAAVKPLAKADKEFVKEAAMGGMAEVALGKIAEQSAADPEVKQFGQRMVQDHSKANDELKAIVADKGIELPQQLDKKHAKDRDKLQKLQGAAFDRAFMKMMVEDHDKVVKKFKHQAKTGKDDELRSFAEKTVPVLEEHDRLAHQVRQGLTATGSTAPRR